MTCIYFYIKIIDKTIKIFDTFVTPLISAVSAILPGPSTVFPSSLGPQLAEKMSTLKFSKYQLNLSEQNININYIKFINQQLVTKWYL